MACHPEQPFTAAQEERIRQIVDERRSTDRLDVFGAIPVSPAHMEGELQREPRLGIAPISRNSPRDEGAAE